MVSERQEELQAKIRNLRSAAAKGDTYERVVGGGAELTEEMRRSKEKFDSGDNEEQAKLREEVVVKGDKNKAVSELAEGRRTIVPDADEPAMEANLLDSLMVSRAEEFAAELEAVYMPTSLARESERREQGSSSGSKTLYKSTMSEAEAFFSKKSPFQEAAEAKAKAAEASEARARAAKASASADAAPSTASTTSTASSTPAGGSKDDAPGDGASPQKMTGSVGGVWEKPGAEAELETHKPAVGTWGVFERPKDISKAYGGGRDPTVSRTSPSEMRRKDAETQALLASYRGVSSEEMRKENESEAEINMALKEAKRAMMSGNPMRAVSTLDGVKQNCSTHGALGAVVFLELAMALEATGQSYQAQDIYKVLSRSKNRDVRTKARRLNEGLEAIDLLNYGRPGEDDEPSEFAKLCAESFVPIGGVTSYRTYVQKDADGKPSSGGVFAIKDAKEVLMSASRFRQGISSDRILRAFEFLRKRCQEADEVARKEADDGGRSGEGQSTSPAGVTGTGTATPGAAAGATGGAWAPPKYVQTPEQKREAEARQQKRADEKARAMRRGKVLSFERKLEAPAVGKDGLVALVGDLESLQQRVQGGWRLVVRAGDGKVNHVENEAFLDLAPDGVLKAVEPVGFVPVSKQGQWEFDSQERTITLAYKSSKVVGLMDVGGGLEELELLVLDDKMLVATVGRGSSPAARRANEGSKKNPRKAGPTAFKYRLLIRE